MRITPNYEDLSFLVGINGFLKVVILINNSRLTTVYQPFKPLSEQNVEDIVECLTISVAHKSLL